MIESKMHATLKRKLKGLPVQLSSIETGSTVSGFPDIHLRTEKKDILIELKRIDTYKDFSTLQPTALIRIPFRPGQLPYIKKRVQLNGPCFVVLTINDRWFFIPGAAVQESYRVQELYEVSGSVENSRKFNGETLLNILQ